MKGKQSGQNTEFLLNMLLFCVFAFLALAVLLAGARAYRTFAARMDDSFVSRTATGYVTNKVRQFDAEGCVSLVTLPEDGIGLALTAPGQPDYRTLIYYSDGAVRELFARTDAQIDLSSGMEIVQAQNLLFSLSGKRLSVTVQSDSGKETTFWITMTA